MLELTIISKTRKSLKVNVGLEARVNDRWIEIQSDLFEQVLDKKARLYELVPLSTLIATRKQSGVLSTLGVREVEVRAVIVPFHEKPIYSRPAIIKTTMSSEEKSAPKK